MAKKKTSLTPEQRLQEALVPENEWPYQVPKNWCWTTGNVILSPMETQRPDGEYFNYIDIDAIDNKTQTVKNPKRLSTTDAPSRASRKLHAGDTVFSLVRPYLKNIAYIDESLSECIASTGFFICSPQSTINSRYFYLLMTSDYVVNGLNRFMKGDNSPSIRKDDILNFAYPLPPISEQQRIVDCIESLFAKLDEAKQKAQDVLDGFETRKAAILHKAFTGGLTAEWRGEHSNFNVKWEHKALSKTSIEIIDGNRGSNYPKKEEFSSDGYCVFLNTKNVTKQGFSFEKVEFITAEKDALLRKGKLIREDIILTTRGTIGNIAYYDYSIPYDNMRINSGMVIYRNGNEFYKPFLIWLYKSDIILNQIKKMQTGSAQPQLPIKIMKELQLPIPSLNEQKEIVRILDSLLSKEQQAKEAAESVLEQIDLIKKSILARAFRGDLGTNYPTEESSVELLKEILGKQ